MINNKIIEIYRNRIIKAIEMVGNSMEVYISFKFVLNLMIVGIIVYYINQIEIVFYLNENQILYLYSTTAQVIAGLYGLTIAGYIYFESRLNDMINEDETYIDHIEALKKEYFHNIFFTGVISFTAIIISLFCIVSYRIIESDLFDIEAIFNFTIILTVYSVLSIISFSWKVLNPNKMKSMSRKFKKRVEKEKMNIEYTDEFHKSSFKVNLDKNRDLYSEFMIIYSDLEKIIHEFADKLTSVYSNYERVSKTIIRARKPRVVTSIKLLEKNSVINFLDAEKLNGLRRYRNALIHGDDFKVDQDVLSILRDYYTYIEEKYNNWKVENE